MMHRTLAPVTYRTNHTNTQSTGAMSSGGTKKRGHGGGGGGGGRASGGGEKLDLKQVSFGLGSRG